MNRTLLTLSLSLIAACSSDVEPLDGADTGTFDPGPVDSGVRDAGPLELGVRDTGVECKNECRTTRYFCEDGVVTDFSTEYAPCGEPCPTRVIYNCEEGCRTDGMQAERGTPSEACEEGRPKHAGDPCSTLEDCRPTPIQRGEDGTWYNTYIECDAARGVCVEVPAPVIADYLDFCGEDLSAIPISAIGFVPTSTNNCSGAACLYTPSEDGTCNAQGCTKTCTEDQECPQGSECYLRAFCIPTVSYTAELSCF